MYDLIIIGGGPAGYNAAGKAARKGLKVLLAEKTALGGVCLNEGCIPTKTLLYSAKIYDYAKHAKDYGISFAGAEADQKAIVARKNKIVKTLTAGISASLKSAGAEVVKGAAEILKRSAEGFAVRVNDAEYTAKNLLICTGSSAAVPPIPGTAEAVASGFALTNREILDLTAVPARLAVVGGGVIGLEMASYFNSMGSEVAVIEMLARIGGPIDSDVADNLLKNYAKKGVIFKLGARVTRITDSAVEYEYDGKTEVFSADKVLLSTGRRAVTEGLGLINIGVLTKRGAVVTDEYARTNVPNVYAAGDVNGRSMLAHTAYREGEAAVNNILGIKDRINYNSIPAVIYTNPEAAGVGETEESAAEKGLNFESRTMSLRYSGRYLAENEKGDGFVKIISDKKSGIILGLHMIGSYSSEIIYGAAMMVDRKMTAREISRFVFPHPTVCEVIREAMG